MTPKDLRNSTKSSGWLTWIAFLLFFVYNLILFFHSYWMCHFAPTDYKFRKPEERGFWESLKHLFFGEPIARPKIQETPADYGLQYEILNIKMSSQKKLQAWWIPVEPDICKGTVLLFHPWASCKDSLLTEAKKFFELGYNCFLLDFYGNGGSAGDTTTIGYWEADEVEKAFYLVQQNYPMPPFILFGRSMGAVAILRAVAVHRIKPDALLLECPFDRLLNTVTNRCAAKGSLAPFITANFLIFWGCLQLGYPGHLHNPAAYAKKVDIPTLLLHGGIDERVLLHEIERIFMNLKARKKLVLFEGLAHEPYLIAQTEKWENEVNHFLAGL
ncbi:alpha/beta hydrolase [Candidatus Riflebacteria bacterium]